MTLQSLHRPLAGLASLIFLALLAACGGGGGGGSGGGGGPTYPASGAYGWILKANGPTDAPKYGLSLVHPSKTDTEYVIEPASAFVSDALLVSSATIDAANLRTNITTPHALVYIVGGDVRSVPMQANGTGPATRVQRAQTTSACRFVIEANDFAEPQKSRYIVSTAGADGLCDTADDGRAELRLTDTGALGYTPLSGDKPLDVARDPTTLAPRGWINPRNVTLWSTTPATTIATRTAPAAPLTAVVASAYNAALVQDGTRLSVLSFPNGATTTESLLDASLSAGSNWQPLGFDATSFYAYVNSSDTFASTWKLLKVSRSNPSAIQLATGVGLVDPASSMGQNMLYLTVLGQTDNRLIRVAKAGGAAPVVTSTITSTLNTVLTSANGVHQRWRVTGVGTANPSYTIEFVNESDAVLSTVASGFPITMAEADRRDFNASESRTRFVVAGNYGSRNFGDASLIGYDTATQTPVTVGTLPGTSVFGTDSVFASAIAGPGSFGLGFAARSVNGSLSDVGAKVFSYNLGVANSLTLTTVQQ